MIEAANSEQAKPSGGIGKLLLTIYLVLSGTFFVAVLFGLSVAFALWAISDRVPTLEERGERSNFSLLQSQLRRQPKTLNVRDINHGDWTLACLLGGLTDRRGVVARAEKTGLKLDQVELKRMLPVDFKSGVTLIYVARDGQPRWLRLTNLFDQVGIQETVCVEPQEPVFRLPTDRALRALGNGRNQH